MGYLAANNKIFQAVFFVFLVHSRDIAEYHFSLPHHILDKG